MSEQYFVAASTHSSPGAVPRRVLPRLGTATVPVSTARRVWVSFHLGPRIDKPNHGRRTRAQLTTWTSDTGRVTPQGCDGDCEPLWRGTIIRSPRGARLSGRLKDASFFEH